MFKNLFSRKTKPQLLQEKYEKLMQESYQLSTVNRTKSDEKRMEAENILDQIKALEKSN